MYKKTLDSRSCKVLKKTWKANQRIVHKRIASVCAHGILIEARGTCFCSLLTLSGQIFRSFLTAKVAAAGRNWISVTSQVNRGKCRSWEEHVRATLCACMHVFIHAALRKIDHINVKKIYFHLLFTWTAFLTRRVGEPGKIHRERDTYIKISALCHLVD